MQAVLVMFRTDGERRSFSITRDMTVVGRREDCDLRIPLGDISRKHCRFVRDGDTLRIEDLGSSNGTYHNGARVDKEALLQPGDSIQVGPVVFVLQVDGHPADEDLHPMAADAGGMPLYSGGGNHGAPAPMSVDESGPLNEAEALPEIEPLDDLEPLALPEEEGLLGEPGPLDIQE